MEVNRGHQEQAPGIKALYLEIPVSHRTESCLKTPCASRSGAVPEQISVRGQLPAEALRQLREPGEVHVEAGEAAANKLLVQQPLLCGHGRAGGGNGLINNRHTTRI